MPALAPLGPGDAAPDCAFLCDDGHCRRLSEFRGSPLVLVFHPPHWDPAQTEYVAMYNRLIADLPGLASARLISVGGADAGGPWRRLTFDDDALAIPLLAEATSGDGSAAQCFGVDGEAAVFVVDADGAIRWRHDGRQSVDPVALARALTVASSPETLPAPRRDHRGKPGWSRRDFVATAFGITLAIVLEPRFTSSARAEAASVSGRAAPAPPGAPGASSAARPVTLNVNGKDITLQLEPRVSLLDALREYAGLTGTKKGCDHGQCGACTVHVDGRRQLSCLAFAVMYEGRPVTTIEGLARGEELHPLQQAFVTHDGFQCGYCTSGQIMSGAAMISEPWGPDDADVREAMSGNICRCGAYPGIVAAIQDVRRHTAAGSIRREP